MDWTRKSSAMGSPAVFTEALPLEVVAENAVDAKDPPNVPAILEPTIIAATAAADPSIISKAEAALATTTGSKSEGGADGNTEGAAVVFSAQESEATTVLATAVGSVMELGAKTA
jgi:hypothetical protein